MRFISLSTMKVTCMKIKETVSMTYMYMYEEVRILHVTSYSMSHMSSGNWIILIRDCVQVLTQLHAHNVIC